jgi:IS1 family transposase
MDEPFLPRDLAKGFAVNVEGEVRPHFEHGDGVVRPDVFGGYDRGKVIDSRLGVVVDRIVLSFANDGVEFALNVKGGSEAVVKKIVVNKYRRIDGKVEAFADFDSQSGPLFIDDEFNVSLCCIGAFFCRVSPVLSSFGSISGNPHGFLQYATLHGHLRKLAVHSLPLKSHVAAGPLHLVSLTRHNLRLSAVDDHLSDKREELQESNNNQQPCKSLDFALYLYVVIGVGCGVLNFGGWMLVIGRRKWRLLGWLALVVSSIALLTDLGTFAFGRPLAFWRLRWLLGDDEHCDYQPLHRDQLYYRKCLTDYTLCTTVSGMANVLSADKQVAVIGALAEGSSIRSIERITGIHRDTIMRLGVKVGNGCAMLLDSKMQDLDCNYLQLDELWGFIGKKERHCSVDDSPEFGDVWTFCAIDSETKLVPSFRCGKRTHELATEFAMDIAGRMRHRVQVSTDAMHSYIGAMELAFGADVDYGQCVKVYVHDSAEHPERKYSAPHFASAYRRPIVGNPEMERVSTSHVERLNATTRLHVKRLNRLTLAFSKKLENFQAAVALHFAYYNFVRRHNALRMTPAMAAGIERDFWSVGDLVEAVS